MKKPKKETYGWNEETGWLGGDKGRFDDDLIVWYSSPRGAERIRPIHPSWELFVKYFDPTVRERSQGAFCRWCEEKGEIIRRSELSTAKSKEITPRFIIWISKWRRKDEKEVQNG